MEISFNPQKKDLDKLRDEVISYGRNQAKVGDPIKVACLIKENDELISGASGRIEFERLFIEHLWTRKDHRRKGLAKKVLAGIEDAAKEKKVKDILISTLAEETADFYKSLGYKLVNIMERYLGDFNRYILIKENK